MSQIPPSGAKKPDEAKMPGKREKKAGSLAGHRVIDRTGQEKEQTGFIPKVPPVPKKEEHAYQPGIKNEKVARVYKKMIG